MVCVCVCHSVCVHTCDASDDDMSCRNHTVHNTSYTWHMSGVFCHFSATCVQFTLQLCAHVDGCAGLDPSLQVQKDCPLVLQATSSTNDVDNTQASTPQARNTGTESRAGDESDSEPSRDDDPIQNDVTGVRNLTGELELMHVDSNKPEQTATTATQATMAPTRPMTRSQSNAKSLTQSS